ncbi:MAG: type II secretion system protein [Agathobacter sp.]|nr:type II secretion system protein [Agathobacter sp.]
MKAKNEKKDNKGFSLVELIIVIAIMAILVGIVGTQVIPYIDKSRNAKDVQKLSGLCTDAMTAYSSNAATLDATSVYTIEIGDSVDVKKGGAADTDTTLKDAFEELNGIKKVSDLKLESKAGKDVTKVTITCQNTGDMITVTTTLKSGSKAKNFSPITSK